MDKEEMLRKGRAAQSLLESADFISVMDVVRLDAFRGWSCTQPEQRTEREEFYYLLLAAEKLKANLTALASNARFEELKAAKEAEAKAKAQPQPENNDD